MHKAESAYSNDSAQYIHSGTNTYEQKLTKTKWRPGAREARAKNKAIGIEEEGKTSVSGRGRVFVLIWKQKMREMPEKNDAMLARASFARNLKGKGGKRQVELDWEDSGKAGKALGRSGGKEGSNVAWMLLLLPLLPLVLQGRLGC